MKNNQQSSNKKANLGTCEETVVKAQHTHDFHVLTH